MPDCNAESSNRRVCYDRLTTQGARAGAESESLHSFDAVYLTAELGVRNAVTSVSCFVRRGLREETLQIGNC